MSLVKKLVAFLFPLCVLVGVNIYFSSSSSNFKLKAFEKHSSYFIGSSRVQRGIDPELLHEHSKENRVYNVGIRAGTFLHNFIMAEHIIKEYNPKELFIELSPIQAKINPTLESLNINDLQLVIKYFNLLYFFEDTESYLFSKVTIRHSLKKIIMSNKTNLVNGSYSSISIGYEFIDENNYDTTNSFLTMEDLEIYNTYDITDHIHLIAQLHQISEKNHTTIRYFLPITFNREEERILVSKVFQSLSKEQKVPYTKDFLNSISKSIYLQDKNHLNHKGAKIMTNYFKNLYFSH